MFAYKEWTPEGWRALAAGLKQRGLSVVAIGGPGDAERRYLDAVWDGVTSSSGEMAGKTPLSSARGFMSGPTRQ